MSSDQREGMLVLAKAVEIRVRGAMSSEELAEFENLAGIAVPAETILTGVLPDQSALHQVIDRLQSLGLELVAVRRLSEPGRPVPIEVRMLAPLESLAAGDPPLDTDPSD